MAKWKFDPVHVESGGFFVFIEDGYISYGGRDEYSSERIAHFVDWDDLVGWSYSELCAWATCFLNGLPELYATAG